MDFFFNAHRERSYALALSHKVFFLTSCASNGVFEVNFCIDVVVSSWTFHSSRWDAPILLDFVCFLVFLWILAFSVAKMWISLTASLGLPIFRPRATRTGTLADVTKSMLWRDCCCANYMWNSLRVMWWRTRFASPQKP